MLRGDAHSAHSHAVGPSRSRGRFNPMSECRWLRDVASLDMALRRPGRRHVFESYFVVVFFIGQRRLLPKSAKPFVGPHVCGLGLRKLVHGAKRAGAVTLDPQPPQSNLSTVVRNVNLRPGADKFGAGNSSSSR